MGTELGEPDVEAIREYLDGQPLEFALLFGSQATGAATGRSDVDVLIQFSDAVDPDDRVRLRHRIAGELMARLGTDDVDVSELGHLPPEVAHAAFEEGVPLVGDDGKVDEVRRRVAAAYERTAADRKRHREALLRRLEEGTYGR